MYLFSEVPLTVGKGTVNPGAYNLYIIPEKDFWSLAVNKNVTKGSNYDPSQDLAKATMQIGQLRTGAQRLKLYFGHIAPKTCTLQIDYGKERAYMDINEM